TRDIRRAFGVILLRPSDSMHRPPSEGRMTLEPPGRHFDPPHHPGLGARIARAGALLLALVAAGLVSARAQDSVRGRVVSASDASPVPTARVIVGGSAQGTLTDDTGEYHRRLPRGARPVVF